MRVTQEVLDKALDAAVEHHFSALHALGFCVAFVRIGETSRRIVREQLRGVVTAAVEAALVES